MHDSDVDLGGLLLGLEMWTQVGVRIAMYELQEARIGRWDHPRGSARPVAPCIQCAQFVRHGQTLKSQMARWGDEANARRHTKLRTKSISGWIVGRAGLTVAIPSAHAASLGRVPWLPALLLRTIVELTSTVRPVWTHDSVRTAPTRRRGEYLDKLSLIDVTPKPS